jgi:alkaline phosphatase
MKKMDYVDLFALPIPKKNLAKYRRIAQKFGKVIKELGALEYREFVGDDLHPKGMTPWTSRVKLKNGEVLVSSFVIYKSRKHRDQVNKSLMEDPKMKKLMNDPMPFDMKRMLYGGFKTFIHF